MADKDVDSMKLAEYEKYYQELVADRTYGSKYSTISNTRKMKENFARDLALFLQYRSGFVCKINKRFYSKINGYYITCDYTPTTDEFKKAANVLLGSK